VWPTLGSRTAKEQSRTELLRGGEKKQKTGRGDRRGREEDGEVRGGEGRKGEGPGTPNIMALNRPCSDPGEVLRAELRRWMNSRR